MSYNLVDPTTGDLTRVAGSIDTSIIPSNASASNKLVTHQVPYELFTLNNNSGSQKWYKLGKYEEGNYSARLDFVSARVDGQMFESSVRISGAGNDNNYVSWIGEKGCEISTIAVKVDSARNLYIKMPSLHSVLIYQISPLLAIIGLILYLLVIYEFPYPYFHSPLFFLIIFLLNLG